MVAAAHAGIPPHVAIDYTHRMIGWALDAHVEKMRSSAKSDVVLAWRIEAYQRIKRLPNLSEELRKLDPPRVMSPREQRASILGMAKAMGATVRYVEKGSIRR